MQTHMKHTSSKKSGFGLIGLLIVVALMLLFAFGYQKIGSSKKQDADGNTSIGTYEPIGAEGMKGQLETGLEAKRKAGDAVKNIQDRTAHDVQEAGR